MAVNEAIKIVQLKETIREARFLLLKVVISLLGPTMIVGGLMVFVVGVAMFLYSFVDTLSNVSGALMSWGEPVDQVSYSMQEGHAIYEWLGVGPAITCLISTMITGVGICIAAWGGGMFQEYGFNVGMPTSYVYVCRHCGEPMPKDILKPKRCPNCKGLFPIGIIVLIIRFLIQWITVINIIIAIILLTLILL